MLRVSAKSLTNNLKLVQWNISVRSLDTSSTHKTLLCTCKSEVVVGRGAPMLNSLDATRSHPHAAVLQYIHTIAGLSRFNIGLSLFGFLYTVIAHATTLPCCNTYIAVARFNIVHSPLRFFTRNAHAAYAPADTEGTSEEKLQAHLTRLQNGAIDLNITISMLENVAHNIDMSRAEKMITLAQVI